MASHSTVQLKSKLVPIQLIKSNLTDVQTNVSEVQKRRQHMTEYQELFRALFKITDRDVQTRVLNAINNVENKCTLCGGNAKPITTATAAVAKRKMIKDDYYSCGTQTTENDFKCLANANNELQTDALKKRWRRRQNSPFAKKNDDDRNPNRYGNTSNLSMKKQLIQNSNLKPQDIKTNYKIDFDSDFDPDFTLFDPMDEVQKIPPIVDVYTQMQTEWATAFQENPKTKLLPIHEAASQDDLKRVQRQMIVYQFRKINVNIQANDDSGNTPLHFAIQKGELSPMVQYLLENGSSVLATNRKNDNVLHFAIKKTNNIALFERLLSQIKLEDLKIFNNDGISILHCAVINNKYLHAKAIVDHIDNQLGISKFRSNTDEEHMLEEYQEQIRINSEMKNTETINKEKMSILDQQDKKTGRTPLFWAINNRNEIIALMLLAHCSNSRIEDYSGFTPASIIGEMQLNRRLVQAITGAELIQKNRSTSPPSHGSAKLVKRKYDFDMNESSSDSSNSILEKLHKAE